MSSRFKRAACGFAVLAASIVAGCAAPVGPIRAGPERKFGGSVDDLDLQSLRQAIRHSLFYLQKLPADRVVGEVPRRFTAKEVSDSLTVFERLLELWNCECFAREIEARFDFLPSSSDARLSEVLFTGYYQPVIDGSLSPSEKFRFPIYARPPDLIFAERVTVEPRSSVVRLAGRADGEQFLPYYSRREIDAGGSLRGRGLEIAWGEDPVGVFFLHIQGSGLIRLPDG